MTKIREVYAKIGTETKNGVPVEFIEFEDFWKSRNDDIGYVMIYLNDKNEVI